MVRTAFSRVRRKAGGGLLTVEVHGEQAESEHIGDGLGGEAGERVGLEVLGGGRRRLTQHLATTEEPNESNPNPIGPKQRRKRIVSNTSHELLSSVAWRGMHDLTLPRFFQRDE